MPVNFSKTQHNRFVMPTATIVACEHKQESKLVRRRMQSKSGQGIY
jgi:hypothetical protein